jgi:thymidylate kinase
MLITFSGMDGAGKSTQITVLQQFFEGRGSSVSHYWARGGYTPGFECLKFILRLVMAKKLPKAGKSSKREDMIANPKISRVWLWLAISDLILFYTFIRLKSMCVSIVICDRFVEDTRLDFSINFPLVEFEKFLVWRILDFVKPKPDLSFLLMVTPELSISRGLEKAEPFPDDLDTLQKRYKLYSSSTIFPSNKFNVIDCSGTKLKVSQDIMNLVKTKLNIHCCS